MKEKSNNNKNEKYNKIKSYMQDINNNLTDNEKKISNINDVIINIKEQMDKIQINKEKKDINNQNINNQIKFGYNYMNSLSQFMNVNKPYNCLNCKNTYFFNECFDSKENKQHKEHSLKLKNSFNNNGNENNHLKFTFLL